jgi:hypothetical protein
VLYQLSYMSKLFKTVASIQPISTQALALTGAGSGNRTRIISLEG